MGKFLRLQYMPLGRWRVALLGRREAGIAGWYLGLHQWLWHSKVAHFGSLFWPTLGEADF